MSNLTSFYIDELDIISTLCITEILNNRQNQQHQCLDQLYHYQIDELQKNHTIIQDISSYRTQSSMIRYLLNIEHILDSDPACIYIDIHLLLQIFQFLSTHFVITLIQFDIKYLYVHLC